MSTFGSLQRAAEILLIEDNPDDAKLVKLNFEGIDIAHNLHVTGDGDAAMTFLRQEGGHVTAPRPDLILLDLNMPGKDGRAVLQELKEDESLRRIPVIILTTSDADTDRLLAYSLHANAYLTKPLDLDAWEDLVQATARFWLRLVKHAPLPAG